MGVRDQPAFSDGRLRLSMHKSGRQIPIFVWDGVISEDFQDKVLDFQLKAIGTDKKVPRDKVFDFSIMKSLGTN
jgi:hypothetical protein